MQFKKTTIQEDDELYRRNPTISDKMHCVLFVINADHVLGGDHAALLRIRSHMQDMSEFNIELHDIDINLLV